MTREDTVCDDEFLFIIHQMPHFYTKALHFTLLLAAVELDARLERLQCAKLRVQSSCSHQLLVRASLDDASSLEDDNLVCAADRREAVGDSESGATVGEAVKSSLDVLLRLGIEARRRLVEQQNRRVTKQCASDGDPLTLAARERAATLTDVRLVASKLDNEIVRIGGDGSGTHAPIEALGRPRWVCPVVLTNALGCSCTKGNVVTDGHLKEDWLL